MMRTLSKVLLQKLSALQNPATPSTQPTSPRCPTPTHTTPAIPPSDFLPGKLLPETHTQEVLCDALTSFIKLTPQTPSQHAAANILLQKSSAWPNWITPESEGCMRTAFDIFNTLFFNNLLTNYCTLKFKFERKRICGGHCECYLPSPLSRFLANNRYFRSRKRDKRNSRDEEGDGRAKMEKGYHCEIVIFPDWPITCIIPPRERASTYESILLHEMVHAFFAIFACRCIPGGCLYLAGRGDGHHAGWLRATGVAERVARELGSSRIDLRRELSLAWVVDREVDELLSAGELRRVGLDVMRFWGVMVLIAVERQVRRMGLGEVVEAEVMRRAKMAWDEEVECDDASLVVNVDEDEDNERISDIGELEVADEVVGESLDVDEIVDLEYGEDSSD